jgi:electron transfer flavoprotein beta subunit
MNTIVFIKAVPDNTRLRWDATGPQPTDWMMNPLDEYALEAALQLKAATSCHITVLMMGNHKDSLKKCVALGADAVCLLEALPNPMDHVTRAKALATAAQMLAPDATLWLTGQQSLDGLSGATGPLLAALQGWPWVGAVKALKAGPEGVLITADQQQTECDLRTAGPVVVSFIKGLTELRTPNIKGVMAANRADIPTKTLTDIGINADSSLATPVLSPRAAKQAGQVITPATPQDGAMALLQYLKQEGFC